MCSLHVHLNQKIANLPKVENLFVLPCMGDGGLPLAAPAAFILKNQLPRPLLKTIALGPEIEDYQLVAKLTYNLPSDLDINVKSADDLIKYSLDILLSGGIVGLFRGRSEFGPRALCNRTFLALPSIPGISVELNRRLQRSEFMPFAPVLVADYAHQCLQGWTERDLNSLYMTQTFNCTTKFRNACPEVVHIDGTTRPQVIWRDRDPFMHKLLVTVYQKTGSMSLINTSFNVHESPIVGSLDMAIQSVRKGVCNMLLINDRVAICSS